MTTFTEHQHECGACGKIFFEEGRKTDCFVCFLDKEDRRCPNCIEAEIDADESASAPSHQKVRAERNEMIDQSYVFELCRHDIRMVNCLECLRANYASLREQLKVVGDALSEAQGEVEELHAKVGEYDRLLNRIAGLIGLVGYDEIPVKVIEIQNELARLRALASK
jgi:hypothetical protein